MKKAGVTVTKLFGRCLTIQVPATGASFEVKVMGDRPAAAAAREQLIAALAAIGVEVIEPSKVDADA